MEIINEKKYTCIFFGSLSVIIFIASIVNMVCCYSGTVDKDAALEIQLFMLSNQMIILFYLLIRVRIDKHNDKVIAKYLEHRKYE